MLTCELLDIAEALQKQKLPTRVLHMRPGQIFHVAKSQLAMLPDEKTDWAKQVGEVALVPLFPYTVNAENETMFFASALQLASKILATGMPGKPCVYIGHPMIPQGPNYQLWLGVAIQER